MDLSSRAYTWEKPKRIFTPEQLKPPFVSHAQMPFAQPLPNGESWRIFFTSRNAAGKSLPASVLYYPETKQTNPNLEGPLLVLGEPGHFDAQGIMPSCLVEVENTHWLYYIGWNTGGTVPYRLSIGIAQSEDGENRFQKLFTGPVLERSPVDPLFVTTPHVLIENGVWRMWYSSATQWKTVEGRQEVVYRIHYAESNNGIEWKPHTKPAIDYAFDGEAIARPWVVKRKDCYEMFYCYRGSSNFREPGGQTYRLGCAESRDGMVWQRQDERVQIPLGGNTTWDEEMQAYASAIHYKDKTHLLYCGNGFGKSGFGLATAVHK